MAKAFKSKQGQRHPSYDEMEKVEEEDEEEKRFSYGKRTRFRLFRRFLSIKRKINSRKMLH